MFIGQTHRFACCLLVAGLLGSAIPEKVRAENPASAIKAPAVGGLAAAIPAGDVRYNSVTGATPPSPTSSGEICLSAKRYTAIEGATRKIVVKRVFGSYGAVSCGYTTRSKSAVAGEDFVTKKGTLTWAFGDNADKIVKIKILQDGMAETNETFVFQLNLPIGTVLIAPYKATVSIAANEALVLAGASAGELLAAPAGEPDPVLPFPLNILDSPWQRIREWLAGPADGTTDAETVDIE